MGAFFFHCKTALNINTCHVISNILQLIPLFDILKIANCSLLKHCLNFLGDFAQALLIRSRHEDVILTRKSHNCAGTAFVQEDSSGDSKLIE